ncbi:MAG: HEPN domain-containing protein [Chloroflexi bacterium]|nr:HEPN domain-containing protein [Chloroflexota bacterium]
MENEQAVKRWLARAEDDLDWTQASLKEGIYYSACFSAQQAAEKALKDT